MAKMGVGPAMERAMTDRCRICDQPRVLYDEIAEVLRGVNGTSGESGFGMRVARACRDAFPGRCDREAFGYTCNPVDWRARALTAERVAREALDLVRT